MKFINDWKYLVKNAYSIRLIILAGVLSGVEGVLPLFSDAVPRGIFAVLSVVISIAALLARISTQKAFKQ